MPLPWKRAPPSSQPAACSLGAPWTRYPTVIFTAELSLSLKTAGKTPSPPLEVRCRHFSRLIGTVPNERHRVPLPDHAYGHTAIAHNRSAGVRWNPTAPQPQLLC